MCDRLIGALPTLILCLWSVEFLNIPIVPTAAFKLQVDTSDGEVPSRTSAFLRSAGNSGTENLSQQLSRLAPKTVSSVSIESNLLYHTCKM